VGSLRVVLIISLDAITFYGFKERTRTTATGIQRWKVDCNKEKGGVEVELHALGGVLRA
jgi:hypothetical protein